MAVHVRKLEGHGLRRCNRRKLKVKKADDELAPLWADLKAAILKGMGPGKKRGAMFGLPIDHPVYRLVSNGGGRWGQ